MKELLRRLRYLLHGSRFHEELDDEIQFHIETRADEIEQSGISRADALAKARREFGHDVRAREETRAAWQIRWLEDLFIDLRYALRTMRRSPGFTTVAALSLALGIGANTAVFSIVNAVIFRPLRYPEPERLMAIQSTYLGRSEGNQSAQGVFVDWRDRSTSFESIAGARITRKILSGADQARFVAAGAVSFDFFRLIGKQPILGRAFDRSEDQPGRGQVALLDAGFWRREFGGRSDVLGRTVTLDDLPYTIIGVLPEGIRFGWFGATDMWIPLAANPQFRGGGDVVAVGRLRAGVTREAAQAEMNAVMRGIGREHVEDSKTGVLIEPLHDWAVGEVRRVFLILLGAVVFVLLICCANIANLMMARATARQKEIAIRTTLGAGRLRLVRQTLAESILLAAIGGALGLLLAVAAVRAAPAIKSFRIPRVDEIAVDPSVLGAAVLISLASGVLFGLAPAFQIGRGDIGAALQGGATALRRAGGQRLRNALVVAQLALALVLLAGAGLMTNSLVRLLHIDLGFERPHLLTVQAMLPYKKYDQSRSNEFYRRLMAEVKRMPGVEEVTASDHVPLQAVLFPYQISVPGAQGATEAMARNVDVNYLRVLGIPLLAGRDLQPADDARAPVPVLVNKSTALTLFGADNPLGKLLTTNYRARKVLEIVGVVGDAHQLGLTRPPGPQLYLPLKHGSAGYVIARVAPNAGDLGNGIRSAVRALDPEVPEPEISSMDAMFSRETAKPRFYLTLLGAFAASGVILAAIGIYGVMSYTLSRRTREFGIRMALGAERWDILRLALGLGMRLTFTGVVLGVAGALAVTRLLETMLYGVRPGDPLTFSCVVALLAGIEILACYIAARRAAAVDPNVALRHD